MQFHNPIPGVPMPHPVAGVACGLFTRTKLDSDDIDQYQILTDINVWRGQHPHFNKLWRVDCILAYNSGIYVGSGSIVYSSWNFSFQHASIKKKKRIIIGFRVCCVYSNITHLLKFHAPPTWSRGHFLCGRVEHAHWSCSKIAIVTNRLVDGF